MTPDTLRALEKLRHAFEHLTTAKKAMYPLEQGEFARALLAPPLHYLEAALASEPTPPAREPSAELADIQAKIRSYARTFQEEQRAEWRAAIRAEVEGLKRPETTAITGWMGIYEQNSTLDAVLSLPSLADPQEPTPTPEA